MAKPQSDEKTHLSAFQTPQVLTVASGHFVHDVFSSFLAPWLPLLIEKLTLEVFVTNEAAIRLYRKMGFLEEGRRVRHVKIADGKYVDVIVMYVFVKD